MTITADQAFYLIGAFVLIVILGLTFVAVMLMKYVDVDEKDSDLD